VPVREITQNYISAENPSAEIPDADTEIRRDAKTNKIYRLADRGLSYSRYTWLQALL